MEIDFLPYAFKWFSFFTIAVLFAGIVAYGVLLLRVFFGNDVELKAEFNRSPAHNYGLPFSALASFGLVSLLEKGTTETLRFGILGFEFEGPSAQITLWVLCYAVFVWSMVKARK